jgi:hypothetical protein
MGYFRAMVAFLVVIMLAFPCISYARDQEYEAKQVNLRVDGNLGEWAGSDVMIFDQLKDVGAQVPKESDFTGSGMIGWNSADPNRVYFAATITDDENQDIHPSTDTWWEDDSLEVMFDFDNNSNLVQWTIDANGEEISAAGTEENLEWIVVNTGDQYIFEGAIDSTKDNPDKPGFGVNFRAEVDLVIGLAFHFNDCENGTREHQIGWTPGGAWDAACYGDLIFSAERAAVDASDKLAATWGGLKSR